MKGRAINYSKAELGWIEANSTMLRREMHQQFNTKFGRDVSLQNLNALCKRKGWMTGRSGCFAQGSEPHNKGKPFPTAARHPNCRKTQFKKGGEPHNTKHLGHERITVDGYVEVSVGIPNKYTGYGRSYALKHRYLWEQANGPLPDGYALKCLDGNRQNCAPENWEAVHRGVLARLNGGRFRKTIPYDEAPEDLKPVVMASAKLKHAIKEAQG